MDITKAFYIMTFMIAFISIMAGEAGLTPGEQTMLFVAMELLFVVMPLGLCLV